MFNKKMREIVKSSRGTLYVKSEDGKRHYRPIPAFTLSENGSMSKITTVRRVRSNKGVPRITFANLPAHLVSTHIASKLGPDNRKRLALASKTLEATREVRENVNKRKKKHMTALDAALRLSRVVARASLGNVNKTTGYYAGSDISKQQIKKFKLNPYSDSLNVYRYLNIMKKVPKKGTLTNKNIDELKENVLKRMQPRIVGRNMFSSNWSGAKSKNGTVILHGGDAEYVNSNGNNGPIAAKIWITKKQKDGRVEIHKLVPIMHKLYHGKMFNTKPHTGLRPFVLFYKNYPRLNKLGYDETVSAKQAMRM
jgi:hypothetical protein